MGESGQALMLIGRLFGPRKPKTADQMRALDEFIRSIALVTDLRALQNSITSRFRELAACQHGAFCALQDGGTFRVTFTTARQPSETLALSGNGHLSNWLRVNRKVLPIPDPNGVWDYLTDDERSVLAAARVRLCVPLSAVNRLSAIVLLSGDRPAPPDHEQLLLLNSLARQAAVAYDQALLFEMQQERLQNLYRAEQLIVAGQLAANIAHEVKNPLATIRATLQYLSSRRGDQSGVPSNGDAHTDEAALLRASIAEVDRIDRTVRGLLNLSRPAEIRRVPMNLSDVLRESLLLVQVYAQRHSVTISTEMDDPVLPMMGDAGELKQVFMNLLMNACESQPDGGTVRVTAQLSASPDDAQCIDVRIADSGVGMSAEEASKAFDPFFTTKERGTGLGLPVCLQIVSRHGGTIELEHGQPGTTAHVSLPIHMETVR